MFERKLRDEMGMRVGVGVEDWETGGSERRKRMGGWMDGDGYVHTWIHGLPAAEYCLFPNAAQDLVSRAYMCLRLWGRGRGLWGRSSLCVEGLLCLICG